MTSREIVINKGLTGEEVKQLLRRDFERLLANEGLLSPHVAYGTIGWKLRLVLQLPNPLSPESESSIGSKPEGGNTIAEQPALAAIQSLPLSPSPKSSVVSGTELTHRVESPNLERVHNALPVPMNVKQNDGTTSQQSVVYPVPDDKQFAPPSITIQDVSDAARSELKA